LMETPTQTGLVLAAQAGDRTAFDTLVGPYRRELLVPGKWRLLPTRANASPAFGLYRWQAGTGGYRLFGLVVLGMVGEQIAHMVTFLDLSSLSPFALPSRREPTCSQPFS
jgi:hypothetical protein